MSQFRFEPVARPLYGSWLNTFRANNFVPRARALLFIACSTLVAQGCASESRITCMFDLTDPAATADKSAWRGAQLAREMPQPEWAGQQKLDWSRSESFDNFPQQLWPREAQAQESRWKRVKIAALPTSADSEALRRAALRERERGSQIAIGYTTTDLATEGIAAFTNTSANDRAPFLVVGITDPSFIERAGERTFSVSISDDAQAVAAAEFMMDHWGGQCVIVVDSQDQRMSAMGQHLVRSLQTLGGMAVSILDVRHPDFVASLQQAIAAHEDVRAIYAAIGSDLVSTVLPVVRETCPSLPIMGCDTFDVAATDEAIQGATSDVYFSAQAWFGEDAAIEATRFASYYRMTYRQEPTAEAALAFDAANIALFAYVKASRSDPSARPNGAALAYEIASLVSFPGATGRISYRHGAIPMKDVWMVRVQEGKRSLASSLMADRRKAYGISDVATVPDDNSEDSPESSLESSLESSQEPAPRREP